MVEKRTPPRVSDTESEKKPRPNLLIGTVFSVGWFTLLQIPGYPEGQLFEKASTPRIPVRHLQGHLLLNLYFTTFLQFQPLNMKKFRRGDGLQYKA